MLIPARECILVELKNAYQNIETTDQKYETRTRGLCLAVGKDIEDDLVGSTVFFESYKDDALVERDGKKYAFIKAEYILGKETNE
jgi:co-chaperonin GroES (HSP10)